MVWQLIYIFINFLNLIFYKLSCLKVIKIQENSFLSHAIFCDIKIKKLPVTIKFPVAHFSICHGGRNFLLKTDCGPFPSYQCVCVCTMHVLSYHGGNECDQRVCDWAVWEARWVGGCVRSWSAGSRSHWLLWFNESDAAIWMNLRAATSSPTNWAQQNVAGVDHSQNVTVGWHLVGNQPACNSTLTMDDGTLYLQQLDDRTL